MNRKRVHESRGSSRSKARTVARASSASWALLRNPTVRPSSAEGIVSVLSRQTAPS